MADNQSKPRWRTRSTVLLAIALAVLALVLVFARSISLAGPFDSTKRTQIEGQISASFKDQHNLVVGSADFQNVLISQKEANKYVPNLWHSDAVYKVSGSVDVSVDLTKVKVVVGSDGTATVSLPQPKLADLATIDLAHSEAVAKDCGINIFCSVDSLTVFRTAQGTFRDAAAANTELIPRSRHNAEQILGGLLRSAGAKDVKFDWAPQP